MSAVGGREPARWGIAVAVAVLVMVSFISLVNLSPPTPPLTAPVTALKGRPTVKIARPDESDTLLKEEAELRDLRPLFLPTSRNAALPEPRLEPGRAVLDSEVLKRSLAEAEVELGTVLPPVATVGGKAVAQAGPLDALDPNGVGDGLRGFGRRPVTETTFRERGGFIEVTALVDGQRVKAEALPIGARPTDERPWSPLELVAVIDRYGLASPLVVAEGSRIEEVDLHFKVYLTRTYRIGERLGPGIYRVVVAP